MSGVVGGGTRTDVIDTPPGYIVSANEDWGRSRMIDPVCGMEVTPDGAAGAWQHAGTTYYFCSVSCLERFRADPEGSLVDPAGS
jgi:YHS domain-containing protein